LLTSSRAFFTPVSNMTKGEIEGFRIEFQIAPRFRSLIDEEEIRLAVIHALLNEGKEKGEISVVLTDDDGIRELNRDFRGVDEASDVLAFGVEGEGFVLSPEAYHYLGDVIISYPRAVVQAKEAGHSVEDELKLLVVHGVLHLLGYDHEDEEGEALMWKKQEEILAKSGGERWK